MSRNRQALEEFLLRAWPLVLGHEPEACLVIAGAVSRCVSAEVPNTRILGVLSDGDLLAELRASSIVVNPVAVGTGLKVKSVEAICLGLPLVSFATGVEGYRVDPEFDFEFVERSSGQHTLEKRQIVLPVEHGLLPDACQPHRAA